MTAVRQAVSERAVVKGACDEAGRSKSRWAEGAVGAGGRRAWRQRLAGRAGRAVWGGRKDVGDGGRRGAVLVGRLLVQGVVVW